MVHSVCNPAPFSGHPMSLPPSSLSNPLLIEFCGECAVLCTEKTISTHPMQTTYRENTYHADHPIADTRNLDTTIGRPRRTIATHQHNIPLHPTPQLISGIPGGKERNPRPWLGCTCGNRHSFASNASSGSDSGSGRRSLDICINHLQCAFV